MGHTLRDFARLEVDMKLIYTPVSDANFDRAVEMERKLLSDFLPNPPGWLADEPGMKKAWECILHLRKLARPYIWPPDDDRGHLSEKWLHPYYLALLASTLPIVYYEPEQFPGNSAQEQAQHAYWQKRLALTSAGMLCVRLNTED